MGKKSSSLPARAEKDFMKQDQKQDAKLMKSVVKKDMPKGKPSKK